MKHFKIFTLVLFCLGQFPVLNGQESIIWMKSFNWSERYFSPHSVKQALNGGYIIYATVDPDGLTEEGMGDVMLIRLEESGDTLWTKTFDLGESENGIDFEPTSDQGYLLLGNTQIPGAGSHFWLIKTDSQGDTLWTKSYRDDYQTWDYATAFVETNDGDFIIFGSSGSILETPYVRRSFLLRIDSSGDLLWTKEDTSDFNYNSVLQTSDGGFVFLDTYGEMIKTNSELELLWSKTYKEDVILEKSKIIQSPDGEYAVIGNYEYEDDSDISLVKLYSDGELKWTKKYAYDNPYWFGIYCYGSYDNAKDIEYARGGGYTILGYISRYISRTVPYEGLSAIWLIKTDVVGDTLWTKIYGFGQKNQDTHCTPVDFEQTIDGGYIILGRGSQNSAWLIKTDPSGNVNQLAVGEDHYMGSITKLHPNPVHNFLTVEIESDGPYSVEISSLNGQALCHWYISETTCQIDLSNFQSGLYFITIRSKDLVTTRKIIKL